VDQIPIEVEKFLMKVEHLEEEEFHQEEVEVQT
jgi:hypothetical protein